MNWNLYGCGPGICFNKFSRWFLGTLKFKKCCSTSESLIWVQIPGPYLSKPTESIFCYRVYKSSCLRDTLSNSEHWSIITVYHWTALNLELLSFCVRISDPCTHLFVLLFPIYRKILFFLKLKWKLQENRILSVLFILSLVPKTRSGTYCSKYIWMNRWKKERTNHGALELFRYWW